MPIPNSRLVGGVRSWPGVAVGRPSPYALPGSASVVGLLPSVLGSTSPWTWRRVHAAAYSFTTVSSSSRARPVPARGFLRPVNAPGFLCGVLLLDKNPNPSERQPPSRRKQRRYRLTAGIMPEGYAPLAKVARVCDILDDETSALDQRARRSTRPGRLVDSRIRRPSRASSLACAASRWLTPC